MQKFLIIAASLLGFIPYSSAYPEVKEYCEGDEFNIQCARDEVIMVHNALYGRMKLGRCITVGYGTLDCSSDVMSILDAHCSGRRECSMSVTQIYDWIPDNVKPCTDQLRNYLAASSTCVKVVRNTGDCRTSHIQTHLTNPPGNLSSLVTKETQCGSPSIPWIIKAMPGQTIQFTLIDFLALGRAQTAHTPECEVYAVINEGSNGQPKTICGSRERTSIVSISTASSVDVRMYVGNNGENGLKPFILQYEVMGCGHLRSPVYGWVKQTARFATLGCNFTDIAWDLTCQDNVWQGANKSCDAATFIAGASRTDTNSNLFFSQESEWFVIIVISAIAVTLGVLIFLAGVLYLRRKKSVVRQPGIYDTHQHTDLPPYYSERLPQRNDTIPDYSSQSGMSKYIIATTDGNIVGHYPPPNDYSRTWQMQRHKRHDVMEPLSNQHLMQHNVIKENQHENSRGINNVPLDMNSSVSQFSSRRADGRRDFMNHPGQLSEIDGRPIMDHIYESPNFERKCNSLDNPRIKNQGEAPNRGNATYYELDPNGVDKKKKKKDTKK